MRSKFIIHSILFMFLLLTFICGLLHNHKNTLNDYEVQKIVYKFKINKKDDFELPELEKEENNIVYLGEFLLTGYCDCPICQEEWVGTTALGIPPTEEWTIAVDTNIIPLGSYVWIDGHRYRAEDVGGMINNYHIDMFMGSHEECYSEICNGYKNVYIEKDYEGEVD